MRRKIPAAFYRGGTSKAVVFNGTKLPKDTALRDRIFLHVLGSPDPYGRQLNGMGGGLSSLSKVVIVEPSARDDADVDYTFVQVSVDEPVADYGSACGNMASCVGPFAIEEGLVTLPGENHTEALVKIYSTNMDQIYHATVPVAGGYPHEDGDFEIPGVAGTGAKITLDFLKPAGAATGKLLPSGNPRDILYVTGFGEIKASMVDAANPVIFIRADDIGKSAIASPQELDNDCNFMALLENIRCAGAHAMGILDADGSIKKSNPKVAIVSGPEAFCALDGRTYKPFSHDINIRLISMGNVHRAITLTGAMCAAVAAQIPGTLLNAIVPAHTKEIRIGNPSGVLPACADIAIINGIISAHSASTYRTQRRIMEGAVLIPVEFSNSQ